MILDGHRVHYVDEGPRDAPVLLFVHPGAGWSFTYRYHIQQLKNEFRCVAPDLPGYGLSEAADGYRYTLQEQADVLEQFVEALDLRRIVAWANDGGGPTVVLALSDHTDRVLGLVVGGTFGWSIKPYRMVVWPLRVFTSRVFRAVNRYTNLLAWSMGSKMALGTRALTKAERGQYTLPFKERNSRNRTLKLYASFLEGSPRFPGQACADPVWREGCYDQGTMAHALGGRTAPQPHNPPARGQAFYFRGKPRGDSSKLS